MKVEADIPVLFGFGVLESPGEWTGRLGRRVLLISGRSASRAEPIRALLEAGGRTVFPASVAGEPDQRGVEALVAQIAASAADSVVAVGGGSVIDAGKAAAVLATNPGGLLRYVEIVGKGEALALPGLPMVAIPTTAGTGAEVTRNAVITIPEARLKVSLRGPFVFPSLAVVDPTLTLELPAEVTASTGMDALTQLIEPLLSVRANEKSDWVAWQGLSAAKGNLRAAIADGTDRYAREGMALAATLSGAALTRAGLGAVHGFASPVGGLSGAAHGAICAALLAPALSVNLKAVRQRGSTEANQRFDALGQALAGSHRAKGEDAVSWVEALAKDLRVRPLSALGVAQGDHEALAQQAAKTSSMKGNPVELSQAERLEILERAG